MKRNPLISSLSLPSIPSVPSSQNKPTTITRANTNPSNTPLNCLNYSRSIQSDSTTTLNWSEHFTRINSLNSPRCIQTGTNIKSSSDSIYFPFKTKLNQDIQPPQIIKRNTSQIISSNSKVDSVNSLLSTINNIPVPMTPNMAHRPLKYKLKTTNDANARSRFNLKQAIMVNNQARVDFNKSKCYSSSYILSKNNLNNASNALEHAKKIDNITRNKSIIARQEYNISHYKLNRNEYQYNPLQCNKRFVDILNTSKMSQRFITTNMYTFK